MPRPMNCIELRKQQEDAIKDARKENKKPIPNTLFELQCIKQWGEKYGWDAVKGLVDARIRVYEKRKDGK